MSPSWPPIGVPDVLILHSRGDVRQPSASARKCAALIPGSRLVPLDSRNHILTSSDPAWPVFLASRSVPRLLAVAHAPLAGVSATFWTRSLRDCDASFDEAGLRTSNPVKAPSMTASTPLRSLTLATWTTQRVRAALDRPWAYTGHRSGHRPRDLPRRRCSSSSPSPASVSSASRTPGMAAPLSGCPGVQVSPHHRTR